jgi:hypothetical protein
MYNMWPGVVAFSAGKMEEGIKFEFIEVLYMCNEKLKKTG